jgi:site-specific DNA-adenine methylase
MIFSYTNGDGVWGSYRYSTGKADDYGFVFIDPPYQLMNTYELFGSDSSNVSSTAAAAAD